MEDPDLNLLIQGHFQGHPEDISHVPGHDHLVGVDMIDRHLLEGLITINHKTKLFVFIKTILN